MSELPAAIETFARTYSFTRSFSYPCEAKRVGPLWVIRDKPRTRGTYRNEEWVASGLDPADVHRIVRENCRPRHAICAIVPMAEPDGPLRDGYRRLGYRLGTTEPLMVHDLERIPHCASLAKIERVMSEDIANRLAKFARKRQILPEQLTPDAPLRQYVALVDGQMVGHVRSATASSMSSCSNMYVLPAFRRRGIARALLCAMLRDDRSAGSRMSMLLASHVGARLYPVVGYRQIGTLFLYTPPKLKE